MSRISRVVIDQQLAEIGVKVTPAKMNITLPRQQMHISQENAQMKIEQQNPQFKFDRQKVMNESGLMSPEAFTSDYANEGKAAALRGAAKITQEGDQLGNAARKGNRVVQIARQNSRSSAQKDINIGLMPKSSPDIQWSPGSMNINWSGHSLKIEWEGEVQPELTVDPRYSVEVFLRTKPYFRVSVEENDFSLRSTGRHVDELL